MGIEFVITFAVIHPVVSHLCLNHMPIVQDMGPTDLQLQKLTAVLIDQY